jgi:hypothetical protein
VGLILSNALDVDSVEVPGIKRVKNTPISRCEVKLIFVIAVIHSCFMGR